MQGLRAGSICMKYCSSFTSPSVSAFLYTSILCFVLTVPCLCPLSLWRRWVSRWGDFFLARGLFGAGDLKGGRGLFLWEEGGGSFKGFFKKGVVLVQEGGCPGGEAASLREERVLQEGFSRSRAVWRCMH